MIKIIGTAAASALTVAGAGYTYVHDTQTELTQARQTIAADAQAAAHDKAALSRRDAAIDEAIKALQDARK